MTELADWVFRLMKSPHVPRYRRQHHLPLKEYSALNKKHQYQISDLNSDEFGLQPPSDPPNHPICNIVQCEEAAGFRRTLSVARVPEGTGRVLDRKSVV